jgi:two-component system sensor histidine kinase HydH
MNIAEFASTGYKSRSRKIAVVAGLLALSGIVYYVIPIRLTMLEGLLTRFFYFPIFLGGLWFGFRGGVVVALLATLICSPHVFMEIGRNQTVFSDELLELLVFNLVGPIVGALSDRERRQRSKNEELQTLAALGEAASSVAHEMKNIVIPMRGFIRRMRQIYPMDPNAASYLEIVEKESARLDRMTQDMLSFARHPTSHREPVDVRSLVEEVRRGLHEEFRSKGVHLVCRCDGEENPVLLNRDRVHLVLVNLLYNALHASIAGKEVRLLTCRQHDSLRIIIEDCGAGIPREHLERIFQPFFTTMPKGTGLGLAITQRVIEEHLGRIQVESELGSGTRFTLDFPAPPGQEIKISPTMGKI